MNYTEQHFLKIIIQTLKRIENASFCFFLNFHIFHNYLNQYLPPLYPLILSWIIDPQYGFDEDDTEPCCSAKILLFCKWT